MDKNFESALGFLNKLAAGTLVVGAISICIELFLRSCDSVPPQDSRPAAGVVTGKAKEERAKSAGHAKRTGFIDNEMRKKYQDSFRATMKPPAKGPEPMKQGR